MKRLQLLLLWVWMVCFSAASHDYMFKHLEVKDGLSNNQVNAIYKDSNGFMWFGTASGLNRYDGYNIKIYRSQKDDEKSLPDSYVEDIQEDTSGNLWINRNVLRGIKESLCWIFWKPFISIMTIICLISVSRFNMYFARIWTLEVSAVRSHPVLSVRGIQ